ncbi:MAG: hypothetical protein ACRC1K_17720 [Planctomycetia bacterium]
MTVRRRDVDLFVAADGSLFGAARWLLEGAAAANLRIAPPASAEVVALSIDGRPVSFPARDDGGLVWPLFRSAAVQEVTLHWRRAGRVGAEAGLPTLTVDGYDAAAVGPHPTLLRLRLPGHLLGTYGDAVGLHRADWSIWELDAERLKTTAVLETWSAEGRRQGDDASAGAADAEPVVERLAAAAAAVERAREAIRIDPSSTDADVAVLNSAEATLLGATPVAANSVAATDAGAPSAKTIRFVRIVQQLNKAVTKARAQDLVDAGRRRPPPRDDFTASLVHAAAARTEYYRVAAAGDMVGLRERGSLENGLSLPPDRALLVVAALAVLAAAAVPTVWAGFEFYWPAALASFGVAWLRWSDQPVVGVVLLAGAAAGVVWLVRRWFPPLDPLVQADRSNHTHLGEVRASSRRLPRP